MNFIWDTGDKNAPVAFIGGFLSQFCIRECAANSSFLKPLFIYLILAWVSLSRQKCVRKRELVYWFNANLFKGGGHMMVHARETRGGTYGCF